MRHAPTLVTLLAAAALPVAAFAVTKTNDTNALNLAASWTGGVAPDGTNTASAGVAQFDTSVTGTGAVTYTTGGNVTWGMIRVDRGTATAGSLITIDNAGGYTITLNGNTSVGGAGRPDAILLNSATGSALQIDANLKLGGTAGTTEYFTASRNLTINGTVDLAGVNLNAFAAGGTSAYNGVISNSAGTSNVTTSGGGTVIFTAANTYTGTTTVTNGTLSLTGSGTLGASTNALSVTGGTLNLGSTSQTVGAVSITGGTVTGGTLTGTGYTLAGGTIASVLAGTGNLTQTGGTVTLSGNNTYTGTTSVNGGRLVVNGNQSSATGATTVAAGATLAGSGTLGGAVTVSGTLAATGSTAGLLTMNAGSTISLTGGATTAGFTSNGVNFAGSTIFSFAAAPVSGNTYTVLNFGSGGITNFSNLQVGSHGTLTQNATNITFTYAGPQTAVWNASGATGTWDNFLTANWSNGLDGKFAAGDTVQFNDIGGATSGTVTLAGSLAAAAVTVNNTATNYTFAGSGTISGTAGLTKSGTGSLTLSGNLGAFSGGLTVNGGTVTVSANQSYTGGTTINAGTVNLAGGGGTTGVLGGVVTINSGGTLRISVGDATGYSTPTGAITINAGGTLNINTTANQTLAGVINLNGGAITGITNSNLDFFNNTAALNSLASSTTATVSGVVLDIRQTNGLTVTVAKGTTSSGVDLAISSLISNRTAGTGNNYGNNPLIKAGAGTLLLTGSNNYTGATTINAGKLVTGNISALGAGAAAVTVNTGGTLTVGDGTVNTVTLGSGASLVINTGGVLQLGSVLSSGAYVTLAGAGTYTFSGALDLNGLFNGVTGTNNYTLITGGSGTGGFSGITGYNASLVSASYSNGILTVTAVPEPSTYGLLGAGTLAAAAIVRRRRKTA